MVNGPGVHATMGLDLRSAPSETFIDAIRHRHPVVAGARARIDLARAWRLAAGFEPGLGERPPLDQPLEY